MLFNILEQGTLAMLELEGPDCHSRKLNIISIDSRNMDNNMEQYQRKLSLKHKVFLCIEELKSLFMGKHIVHLLPADDLTVELSLCSDSHHRLLFCLGGPRSDSCTASLHSLNYTPKPINGFKLC